jgi:hypothetical protein
MIPYTEGGELHITLQKMNKGEVWASALVGSGQASVRVSSGNALGIVLRAP